MLSSAERWLWGSLESFHLVGARLLRERCVCYADGMRSALKISEFGKELIIILCLLDYLLPFHHYTTDLWASPVLCRWSSGPTYQLVCLEKSPQAFLKGEEWNWEEAWSFWSPRGVEEWDSAVCFRNMGPSFAENLVMRSKDCCSLWSSM